VQHLDTSGSAARMNFVNYAFNNVRNNRCEVGVTATGIGDAFADYTKGFAAAESVDGVADAWDAKLAGNWGQLKKLKAKYPNLKVIISLGGWTWSDGFYSAIRPENRSGFVDSCIDAYIRGNLPVVDGRGGPGAAAGVFDGIDLDFEYPGVCGNTANCGASSADRANFAATVALFRQRLNAINPNLLLTAAVAAGSDKIPQYDVASLAGNFNWINIMTYDFFGAWAATGPTAPHSPLTQFTGQSSLPAPQPNYTTDYAVQAWANGGTPKNKLLIGIGFYGRGWNGSFSGSGINQPATGAGAGTYEAGIEDYKVLISKCPSNFIGAGTAWCSGGSQWWSYDTPTAIGTKMSYVKNQGLAGAFFWSADGDTSSGTLARAMRDNLP
jgi:chitinase